MAYVIKFLSLQKAELEYEVELRGGNSGSVQELRKQIVKLEQNLHSEDILESHLEPEQDLIGLTDSILKAQSNLTSLGQKFDKNLFTRTETLLHCIYHRLNRLSSVEKVASGYKTCLTTFEALYKELSTLRPHNAQTRSATTSLSLATGASSESSNPTVSVTCERSVTTELSKLKFSGKTCVRSFIIKVEEFVLSRGISYDKVLSMGYEIFTDDALHWYRCNKDNVHSWNELCELLKEDFSSSDYDYKLAAEIRSRTQGETENITIYLSIMHGMFSRLNRPISENDQLEILLHNIRPCYAGTLSACPDIKTIASLKGACRGYENVQARFSHFREPPKVTTSTIAPDFAYKGGENSSSSASYFKKAGVASLEREDPVAVLAPNTTYTRFCPRCRTNDHSLRYCRQERFIICFTCGKKGFRSSDCPDCKRKGSEEGTIHDQKN